MSIGWFIAICVIHGTSLLCSAHLHGKPKDKKHNFWADLVISALILFLTAMAVFA